MGNHIGSCPLMKIVEAYFGPILPVWLPDRDYPTVGVILLGNTGVGKSFLANVILGKDVFEHRCSTRSVTHTTEWENVRVSVHGRLYIVFNVPGLIEYDQKAVDRNKIQIQKAFEKWPDSIVASVFANGAGGRLREEDLVAFNALKDAYQFRPESLMFIINDLPSDHSPQYEGETVVRLEHLLNIKRPKICFVNRINTNSWNQKGQLRMKLLETMASCTPSTHQKNGEVILLVDKLKQLEAEARKRQNDFEAKRRQLEAQVELQQQELEALKRNDLCVIL